MKQWIVDRQDVYTEDELSDLIDRICNPENYEDEDEYDDHLNEVYNYYRINGCEFSPSEILKSCDEDAYYDCLRDWAQDRADEDKTDCLDELEMMNHDDETTWNGYYIRCEEIDEDEEEEEEATPETVAAQQMWDSIFTVHAV